jgi:UDP-glucose 4-epimerase
MNVVVTGGAGFIGSHVAEALIETGHAVAVIDNLSTGRRQNVPVGCALLEMDLRDPALAGELARRAPEAVFHFAAQIDLRRSLADPVGDAEDNLIATLRLLEATVASGAGRFVFASSGGAIYGEASGPQDEQHREAPLSPYGVAKLAVDKYLDVYRRQRGLRAVSLRLSNVYGPRQSAAGEAGVVGVFARRLADGRPLRVHGDGLQTRDFVAVRDVAALAPPLLERDVEGTFNLGTGIETSVRDLAARMCARAGRGVIDAAPAGPGEQRRAVLDAGKAGRELGWRPATALDDGLRDTLEWFAARRSEPA